MELVFKGYRGKNAVSYLMKVKNYSFLQAVETIIGNVNIKQPIIYKQEEKDEEIKLILPQKSVNSVRAKKYLESRNIASEIIKECIDNNMIYESMPNHNVVFVAFDDSNVAEVVNTLNEYVKGHKNDYEVPLKEWKIEKINGERMPVLVD